MYTVKTVKNKRRSYPKPIYSFLLADGIMVHVYLAKANSGRHKRGLPPHFSRVKVNYSYPPYLSSMYYYPEDNYFYFDTFVKDEFLRELLPNDVLDRAYIFDVNTNCVISEGQEQIKKTLDILKGKYK